MFEIIPQWEWIEFKSREIAEADFRRLQLLYLAGVYHLDRLVGDLVKRLKTLDPDRRTLIVLTSDHGEEFNSRNVGHVSVREDVMRIPLAFYWPGKIAPARITEAAPLVDVFPTLFEILDIPIPPSPSCHRGRPRSPTRRPVKDFAYWAISSRARPQFTAIPPDFPQETLPEPEGRGAPRPPSADRAAR